MSGTGRSARRDVLRWCAAAAVAIGFHAAAVAIGYDWPMGRDPTGAPTTAVMVELAPDISFPEQASVEAPDPGPVMEQAEPQTAASEPPAETKADIIAPPAPVESDIPIVEQQNQKPEAKPKHDIKPVTPKKAAVQPREKIDRTPAPRTTAPPKAVRTANAAAPANLGERASSESLSTYAARVAAHIGRFKQYPPSARNQGSRGVARVSYTVTRSGQLASVRLSSSSGNALLDQEAVSAVRRAQPLPQIPANLPQPQALTTPIQFSVN